MWAVSAQYEDKNTYYLDSLNSILSSTFFQGLNSPVTLDANLDARISITKGSFWNPEGQEPMDMMQ